MEFFNPILGNPLLLIAIVLFLALLPRALRQKKKSKLDKTVEQFEKEELQATVEQENPDSPEDHSLGYSPFEIAPEKTIKKGIPISHNEVEPRSSTAKKKAKLIKQKTPNLPEKNRASEDKPSVSDPALSEESEGNWIEAEIPGLIMEPLLENEEAKDIPTFEAALKTEHQSESEKPPEPLRKEKPSIKVKNHGPKSEEKEDSKSIISVPIKTDPPETKIEISEPKPIVLEIKAPIVSHKSTDKKGTGRKKTKANFEKVENSQETESTVSEILPQQEDTKSSSEKVKAKPFLLDLKYMIQEELETENPVSHEKFHSDMVDAVVARLNTLQTNLENQFVARHNPINGNMQKDRTQESLPSLQGATHDPSNKKEVSLDELDSFLFTATQRKNRE